MEVASLFFLARRRWKKQGHAPLSSGGRRRRGVDILCHVVTSHARWCRLWVGWCVKGGWIEGWMGVYYFVVFLGNFLCGWMCGGSLVVMIHSGRLRPFPAVSCDSRNMGYLVCEDEGTLLRLREVTASGGGSSLGILRHVRRTESGEPGSRSTAGRISDVREVKDWRPPDSASSRTLEDGG